MAVTVAQIIEGARDHHTSLDPFTHPDAVGVRFADRYHKRLVLRVVQINPDLLAQFDDVTLPLADFDTGQAADAHHQYLSGKAFYLNNSDLYDRLELLPWEARNRGVHFPAYSLVNGNIKLHRTANDWTMYGSLEIRFIPMTATLTGLTSAIVLPDTALDCMATGLAYFWMRRQPEQPFKNYLRELRSEWNDAEVAFLGEIAGRKRYYDGQINEIW